MSTSRASRQSRRRTIRPTSLREKITRFKTPQTSVEDETERHPSVYAVPPDSQRYPPPVIPSYPVPPRSTSYTTPAYASEPPVLRHYGRDPFQKEHQYDYNRGYDVPTMVPVPPRSTMLDAEEYVEFFWKTNDLLSELARLKFALGTVGGCGPAIRAIDAIHKPLQDLQWLFGFNTYALSPQPSDPRFKQLRPKNDAFLSIFPHTLEGVSVGLGLMEKAFEDFQNAYYEDSTMYLLMCLRKRFKCEARRTTIGRGSYATPSTEELKNKIQLLLGAFLIRAVESLRKELSSYCEKGIPVISSMQKNRSTRYLNLTTIATFLSGVTASLLQISADDTDSPLAIGVNTFLFSSLTFSIASVINSLLAVIWLKSVVRDPAASMPMWSSACIYKGPMISLVISIVLFAAALCLFVFSSSQHIVTSTVTVSFAGLYSMCLFVLALWLILEKWNFRNVAGASGRSLTHDSLSMAIIEKLAVWPGANLFGTGDPSQLERGRYPTTSEIGRPPAHAVWDGFLDGFLSGTESTVGGPGRTGDERHYYYGRPSRSSEAARRPSSVDFRYGEPLGTEGPKTPSSINSEALGYAPTVIDGYEDYGGRTYQSAEPHHRRRRTSDSRVNDDAHDAAAQYGPPEPIYIRPPPVDSRTYETAQFLPRDEQGELEEDDTSTSDSGRSPVIIPPPVLIQPPSPYLRGPSVPTPMPTSQSERVMVIPTNPPTYVVPPGSYVAYGTQPTIGSSAQAGNYTVYQPYPNHPTPAIPFSPFGHPQAPQIPIVPPFIPRPPGETIIIPPRPRSRSRERDVSYMPEAEDGRTDLHSESDDGTRITIPSEAETSRHHHRDRTSLHNSSARGRRQTQSSRRSSDFSSAQGRSTVDGHSQPPVTTSQSRHPYPPRSSLRQEPRRPASSSSQVRFARQVVAGPQRRRSTAEQSVATGEQSTTSVLSQTLTDSPEKLEETGVDEPGTQGRIRPSRLDVLQSRHRRTTPDSQYGDREHDPFRSGSRPSTADGGLGLEVGGEPQSSQSSSATQHDTNAPSAHDPGRGLREHVPEDLPIIEETSRFSAQIDPDSSDSERSAVTAPEATSSEFKPSTD